MQQVFFFFFWFSYLKEETHDNFMLLPETINVLEEKYLNAGEEYMSVIDYSFSFTALF